MISIKRIKSLCDLAEQHKMAEIELIEGDCSIKLTFQAHSWVNMDLNQPEEEQDQPTDAELMFWSA